ncbi:MAG: dTDP-4-dehydrorhamnose reductase family protein [Gemmatimonadales bacterium]
MNTLVLGGTGMLGHQVVRVFAPGHATFAAVRGSASRVAEHPAFAGARVVGDMEARDPASVERILALAKPALVVNCVGIIKQLPEAGDAVLSEAVNARFPHALEALAARDGFRLIHISTDCVFSGRKGRYREGEPADAADTYGRSKLAGEVTGPGCLTLRTSLVGPELERHVSLLEWLLSNAGKRVRGFTRAIFSGLSTKVLARELLRIAERHPELTGLYHVGVEPISKYDLLVLLKQAFHLDVEIEPSDELVLDRSLDSGRYLRATGFVAPTWRDMAAELARDVRATKGRTR